ncbi:hypothetical protein ROLI_034110 [Roseobacter fucihabitans]|uniref:Lipoprotein n=1 Tax=Roseobacter fucihabitans TaxID=1537242 RepID=A0ABZ2BWA7_9RHOB|nr:hypothetical protein [Roseobacter litoralis]MBC6967425.1 hypothetical protein [Roseobacter litoralis]
MPFSKMILVTSMLAIAGCAPNMDFGANPTTFDYTEASASGLSAVRPYPNPDDVCQVIRENEAIREPVTDGTFLIACPKHERGAINDRINEGAEVVGHARNWTVMAATPIAP